MEYAPDLQFKHYTVAEARLPAEALMNIPDVPLGAVAICCDLDRHVFYAKHTDARVRARRVELERPGEHGPRYTGIATASRAGVKGP